MDQHLLQSGLPLLASHSPRVGGTLVRQSHGLLPEKSRPQSAFHADVLNELKPAAAGQVVCFRVLRQELLMLSDEGGVWCPLRGEKEVVGSLCLPAHVFIRQRLDAIPDRRAMPAEAHHGGVLPIARLVLSSHDRAHVNLQRR